MSTIDNMDDAMSAPLKVGDKVRVRIYPEGSIGLVTALDAKRAAVKFNRRAALAKWFKLDELVLVERGNVSDVR